MNEKYEKKRKELMILDKQKKMEEIKKRNMKEQSKKEKERQKIYEEKKFIDYISNRLKKNYTLKEEKLKYEGNQRKKGTEKNDLKEEILFLLLGVLKSKENLVRYQDINKYFYI